MSRYLLFSGDNYYPFGGMLDFDGFYLTVESAVEAYKSIQEHCCGSWCHVWDSESGCIVVYGEGDVINYVGFTIVEFRRKLL